MGKFIVIVLVVLTCLSGCGVFGGNQSVLLWSQTAEILPYVDRYNAVQGTYKIQVQYVQSPADELLITEKTPDLVLAERLTAPRPVKKLDILNDLLNPGGINPDLLYRELLAKQLSGNAVAAIPFSFHLPIIVSRRENINHASTGMMSLEELKAAGLKSNNKKNRRIVSLGFSPFWNKDFVFSTAALFGVRFRADPDRPLVWNETELDGFMNFLSGWSAANGGGYALEEAFIQKYLYEPPYKLVTDKRFGFYRINYYCTVTRDFFTVPREKREDLDFAWLSKDGKIPVDDAILFFGIPKGTQNRAGAGEFLKWVFTPSVQADILKENRTKGNGSFGIANGFSSIKILNEQTLPAGEPLLSGRVPEEASLAFPDPVPETWEKLKDEIILPWIAVRLTDPADTTPLTVK